MLVASGVPTKQFRLGQRVFHSTNANIGVACDCRPVGVILAKVGLLPTVVGDEIMNQTELTESLSSQSEVMNCFAEEISPL